MAVPRRVRQRQVELARQPFGDFEAVAAERGEGAGGAAELQRQRACARGLQAVARAVQGGGVVVVRYPFLFRAGRG